MPLVSVIMPAYNASEYIGEAIDSLLNQTEKDFELLICDDGSTDDTLKIMQSYQDERIRIFSNGENKGNLFSTNRLFQECTGHYITIQDADDYSSQNRMECLLNMFKEYPELGMVGSNFEIVDEIKNSVSCGFLPLKNEEIKQIMQKELIPMLYASVMVKREVFKKVDFFPAFFNRIGYADLDWLSRCAEHCKVANTRSILYYYRKHSNSFNFHHQHKKKDFLLENMDVLIVEAHRRRISGKSDYFASSDKKAMMIYLSDYYLKRAECAFWDNNFLESRRYIRIALKSNLRNKKAYRTLFFIVRKSLFHK